MRISRESMDLGYLTPGVPCDIATGKKAIDLTHGNGAIQVGLRPMGAGSKALLNPEILRVEAASGTYWLRLDLLAPDRLYRVVVKDRDPSTGLVWEITDRTDGFGPAPDDLRSGGNSWGLLGRLLGGRRG